MVGQPATLGVVLWRLVISSLRGPLFFFFGVAAIAESAIVHRPQAASAIVLTTTSIWTTLGLHLFLILIEV